jgi:hypothetical protein
MSCAKYEMNVCTFSLHGVLKFVRKYKIEENSESNNNFEMVKP